MLTESIPVAAEPIAAPTAETRMSVPTPPAQLAKLSSAWTAIARTPVQIDETPDVWVAAQIPEIAALRLYAHHHGQDCYLQYPKLSTVYNFYLVKPHARHFPHFRETVAGFRI